jgi:ABC-type sugar transport system ATPase subunit
MLSEGKEPLLRMEDISKSFPGIRALREVNFELWPKEVHVLVGQNGAGKSTLIKILSGAYRPDGGKISIDGKPIEHLSPHSARELGIATIYQEFNLIPDLSVAENIFLGSFPTKGKWFAHLDFGKMRKDARAFLNRLGMDVDPDVPVRSLSVAQNQLVEIAKALSVRARIIILDEPTATLTNREISRLFDLIVQLKDEGIGLIYISHRLEEVKAIGDRVTVLHDGVKVGTWGAKAISPEELIRAMVGREVETQAGPASRPGEIVLELKGVSREAILQDIRFQMRKGEILGVAGLVGAGRTELARAIFGADPIDQGEVWIEGRRIRHPSCKGSVRLGLGFLPEDRKTEGLILNFGVQQNISLSSLGKVSRLGFIKRKVEKSAAQKAVQELSIRTGSPSTPVRFLSGGNQQKVVLAKWLFTEAGILIFDEPTRGIDVGAKEEFYRLIQGCAEAGTAVLFISSELSELIRLCTRLLVMRGGRIVGEIPQKDFSEERILSLAFGKS